ncbi:transporter [Arthrobacter sp. H14-L1]|uniref:transporter n=1 Tax=Arthrobacter sp. H14-L1 TaxID=2996697 RepID=UPI002271E17F|nr:transporter [Arthrobacter sp. H14-L1]MCY0905361.1 transporter [Arthrobacter sp. H14-L1]
MVADLLRLKLTLLRNSLRRSPWQLVGLIIGGLYGLGVLTIAVIGLLALSAADVELAKTVIVLAGSAVVLGWLVIPVFASGVDMTLDPARFTTFAVPMKQLLAGLAFSGFLGIPGAITLLASLGTVGTWWRHPLAMLAAAVCAVLAVLTCIVASRAITSASTNLSSSRRFKDVSGVLLFLPLILLGPIISGLRRGVENAADVLPGFAQTLSWTPLGAVWSVPADLAAGSPGQAALKFLIALATLAVLTWLWKISLAKALVTPVHSAGVRRTGGKLGAFDLFPGTEAGAVAARAMIYWLRDPRYTVSLITAAVIPLVFTVPALQSGSLGILNFAGAIAVFFLVWSISADISYDNTAFALHVGSGVRGRADRAGRALACGVLAVPLGLIYNLVGAAVNSSWIYLPALMGLTLGLALSGLGLSSVVSAWFTYNAPAPGDSPFKSRPGNNFAVLGTQLGGYVGLGVLVLPEIILTAVAFGTGRPVFGWICLAVGLVLGMVLLSVGIVLGGRLYDKRAPELLAALVKAR